MAVAETTIVTAKAILFAMSFIGLDPSTGNPMFMAVDFKEEMNMGECMEYAEAFNRQFPALVVGSVMSVCVPEYVKD